MDYILGICLVFMVAYCMFGAIDILIQTSKIKSDDEDNEYHKLDPKEKANKLVDAFYQELPLEKYVTTSDGELSWDYNHWNNSKQCALIAVDEILTTLNDDIRDLDVRGNVLLDLIRYWRNVKKEIKKL